MSPIKDPISAEPATQDPELLRRLLRAKDRMDAASQEEWPVPRLARVGGGSGGHFARWFKRGCGLSAGGGPRAGLCACGGGARAPVSRWLKPGVGAPAAPIPAHAPRRA